MSEIMGTVFLVQNTWYLRYLHGGGAMVPIEGAAPEIAKLEDGRMVRLVGHMSTDRKGCPRAALATSAEILG